VEAVSARGTSCSLWWLRPAGGGWRLPGPAELIRDSAAALSADYLLEGLDVLLFVFVVIGRIARGDCKALPGVSSSPALYFEFEARYRSVYLAGS